MAVVICVIARVPTVATSSNVLKLPLPDRSTRPLLQSSWWCLPSTSYQVQLVRRALLADGTPYAFAVIPEIAVYSPVTGFYRGTCS
jgi:uncharacterized protein (DUF2237 family)